MSQHLPQHATTAVDPAAAPTPEPASTPAARRRRIPGSVGIAAALVLAFVWGGLAYRELGPARAAVAAPPRAVVTVAGSESPPAWVDDFATAFCDGDAAALAERIGPPLSGDIPAIEDALVQRQWSCADMRYIGGGSNVKGTFYVFVMRDGSQSDQWWVFTVLDEQVVAIE